jgi:hypothetical protein
MFEMLSFRTVMSLLSGTGGNAGTPGTGGTGTGGIGFNIGNYTTGRQINIAGRGFPGAMGSAFPRY